MPGSGPGGIAVYGPGDDHALHVRMADEAYRIESDRAIPYLDIPALIAIACRAKARLVHPGYGFLAENATFAEELCTRPGLSLSDRRPSAIATMGDKVAARAAAVAAGVPILPGTTEPVADAEAARAWAAGVGYPVVLKAAAGRRRSRIPDSRTSRRPARRIRQRPERGRAVVRGWPPLCRALPDAAAACRSAGLCRSAGQRDRDRRPRLLDSAPTSEVDRGEPCPQRAGFGARADGRRRDPPGQGRWLCQRGHPRVPRRAGWPILVPGDEHADPGRAHGHRGGAWRRPGPRAAVGRAR